LTLADAPVNRIAPAGPRQHAFGRLLGYQEAAKGGDRQRLLHVGGIELDKRPAGPIARVVDNDIERAERRFDVGKEFCHLHALCRIAGKGLAADFLGQLRKFGGPARSQRDGHTGSGESPRQRGREPGPGPDDQRGSIGKFGHATSTIGSMFGKSGP
jgi:hypothetical protein